MKTIIFTTYAIHSELWCGRILCLHAECIQLVIMKTLVYFMKSFSTIKGYVITRALHFGAAIMKLMKVGKTGDGKKNLVTWLRIQ